MATTIKHPYTAPIDFRKTAEDDIVTAFYKNNEVKLIYSGDKKVFESQRLYTTFIAEKNPNNGGDYLYIDNLSSLGKITELYINGVSYDVPVGIRIETPVNVKIKGQFTVQDSTCDMHDFFIADGLESVVNVEKTMFRNCTGIENLDLTYFNTSTVKGVMQNLFASCTNLKTININSFDMTNITSVASMFNSCSSLESIDIRGWKHTDNITTAGHMFKGCDNLKEIYLPQLPSLTNMQSMFFGCTKLEKIDMRYIDGSNLTVGGVGSALLYVPNNCTVIVNSQFSSKFEPGDLSWGGTFITV